MSGILEQLSGVFYIQGGSQGCIKDVVQYCSPLKALQRSASQKGSLMWLLARALSSSLAVAGDLSVSPHGASPLDCSHRIANCPRVRRWSGLEREEGKKGGKSYCAFFLTYILKSHTVIFTWVYLLAVSLEVQPPLRETRIRFHF